MSITTYDELKTAIADWSHRIDLTSKLSDFISLAESRINRNILFNEQEIETPLTATVGSRYIALPAGFIAPIELWNTYFLTRDKVQFVPVDTIPVDLTSQNEPEYWTIDGSNIAFDVDCDVAYTFDFRYRGTDNLSDSNTTNWLLTNHPDVYLYASLMEVAGYIRDMEQLAVWKQGFDIAIQEVLNKEHRTKAKATLMTGLVHSRSNIFEG